MKYDFKTHLNRKGMDSIAVEPAWGPDGFLEIDKPDIEDTIPMWIADMNFATLPDISEKIIDRARHPLFGYFMPRDEWYEGIIRWHKDHNGVNNLTNEHIAYENGVLGGVASALAVLANKAAPVLVHSPTYIGFTETLNSNGYTTIHSPLIKDQDGIWRMDYDDMDRKIKKYKIHVAIFCSPHNPCGRVWERWEIEKAMEIYRSNDVYVISDEIWSDLTLYGNRHIPTQSISEDAKQRTVAFYAPSKTFNLAGLIGSYRIVYSRYIRERMDQYEEATRYNQMNVLSMYAAIAAYSDNGSEWLEQLKVVLEDNITYACDFIKEHFEGVKVMKPEGTYMLFIDCAEWLIDHQKTIDELYSEGINTGVLWQNGRHFAEPHSIRMNLALPHDLVIDAFNRLDKVFNQ